jgi:alkaline phosphatase D
MNTILDRRKLLTAAGGVALFTGLGSFGRVWAQPAFTDYPFQLGVAAGDPLADGFVIWTRLAPRPLEEHGGMPALGVPVRWEVAEDEKFARIVRSGEAIARPELGHSVHVEVGGLQPWRRYFYRFAVQGADASPVGRARTAPAAGETPARLRLVSAGCQNYPGGWFDAWRHISEEPELDAVFHYGDYIYETGPASNQVIRDAAGNVVERRHFGNEIYSLDDYRRRYAQYKMDPHLRAAHHAAAFISSFDDHEVDNDWASAYDQDGTPPELFALRKAVAMQAWYENMPVRPAQLPTPAGVIAYRRLDYGRLLRMHVLDTRSYRPDQLCTQPDQRNCRRQDGPGSSILGAEQEAWLNAGLTNGARWNLLAQQVRVMPFLSPNATGVEARGPVDKWSGYTASRTRLVKAITDRKLTNVVIATGDAHVHNVGVVPLRDEALDGPAAAVEFLATSITSGGDGAPYNPTGPSIMDGRNPHLALHNTQRGYQTFDVTPNDWRTDVKVLDRVQSPGGALSTLARFAVTPEKAALHKA